MSGNRLYILGTDNISGNGADSPAENRSSSSDLVACHETGPRVMEPAKTNSGSNAPKCSRKCSLFVRLPSPGTGRPRLGRETQLLERILKGPRPKTSGYSCGYQIPVRRFLIGRTVLRFSCGCSSTEGFCPSPGFPGLSVNCAERGQPPALRRTSRMGLRLQVFFRPPALQAPALLAPASSPFDPE